MGKDYEKKIEKLEDLVDQLSLIVESQSKQLNELLQSTVPPEILGKVYVAVKIQQVKNHSLLKLRKQRSTPSGVQE